MRSQSEPIGTKVKNLINSENLPPNVANELLFSNLTPGKPMDIKTVNPPGENIKEKSKEKEETEEKKEIKEETFKNESFVKPDDHQKSFSDITRVIPVYINTIPKNHREKGRELVSELLSSGVIDVDSDGDLTISGTDITLGLEPFLRSIFVKRASLKESESFFRKLYLHIPTDIIENPKLLSLISEIEQQGAGIFPNKLWCMLN